MRESKLEGVLTKRVRKAGGLCFKLPAQFYRGIPDRLVLLPGGRVFFVELKKEEGSLIGEHQLILRKSLWSLGFSSIIISGKDDLERFLREHVEG